MADLLWQQAISPVASEKNQSLSAVIGAAGYDP